MIRNAFTGTWSQHSYKLKSSLFPIYLGIFKSFMDYAVWYLVVVTTAFIDNTLRQQILLQVLCKFRK